MDLKSIAPYDSLGVKWQIYSYISYNHKAACGICHHLLLLAAPELRYWYHSSVVHVAVNPTEAVMSTEKVSEAANKPSWR